jgi:hypothetical protein
MQVTLVFVGYVCLNLTYKLASVIGTGGISWNNVNNVLNTQSEYRAGMFDHCRCIFINTFTVSMSSIGGKLSLLCGVLKRE